MKRLIGLTVILCASLSPVASKERIITGVIEGFDCGMEPFLIIRDAGGEKYEGVCLEKWCEQAAWEKQWCPSGKDTDISAKYVGKTVRVTVGRIMMEEQPIEGECSYPDCGYADHFSDINFVELPSGSATEVELLSEGGTLKVPVLINGVIELHFTLDSGAADVSIPADVVSVLFRTGTLRESDFLGERSYVLADGSIVPSKIFRIRSLKVGDRVIENVVGSAANEKGGLLLGQSFLKKFNSWSIDNSRKVLVLN